MCPQYQHNGSEVLTDQFSLVARVTATGERDSLPATVKVTVMPVDDEKPRLVNNSGLSLYEGAKLVLRPDHLGQYFGATNNITTSMTVHLFDFETYLPGKHVGRRVTL